MKRIGGFRRKTRHLLKKHIREKGKISLTRYFQSFNEGDAVKLVAEPSIHKGMFHPRFYGKNGVIQGRKGKCYEVLIADGGKQKTLIIHPIHLQRG